MYYSISVRLWQRFCVKTGIFLPRDGMEGTLYNIHVDFCEKSDILLVDNVIYYNRKVIFSAFLLHGIFLFVTAEDRLHRRVCSVTKTARQQCTAALDWSSP